MQACEELGIGFVPWGPLGMGYLPGDVESKRKARPTSRPACRLRTVSLPRTWLRTELSWNC